MIDPDAVAQHLGDALGLQGVQRSSWERPDVRRHDTWSATWGLPRPSLIAVRPGLSSSWRAPSLMKTSSAAARKPSRRSASRERRAEGFRRVLIDSDVLTPAQPTSPAEGIHEKRPVTARTRRYRLVPGRQPARPRQRGAGRHGSRPCGVGSREGVGRRDPAPTACARRWGSTTGATRS